MKNIITDDIVEAFKMGDDKAFNKIYEHYYKKIYFYVYKHCYNKELAEDVTQNAFISAYRSKEQLKHNMAFHNWMFRIAHNEMKKIIKKDQKNKINIADYLDLEAIKNNNQYSVNKEINMRDMIECVDQCIEGMKPKHKDVAILHYYYGLTNQEIASVLTIPLGTVKSRIHHINRNIQYELTNDGVSLEIINSAGIFPIIITTIIDNLIKFPKMPLEEIIKLAAKPAAAIGAHFLLQKALISLAIIMIPTVSFIAWNQSSDDVGVVVEGIDNNLDIPAACAFVSITYDESYIAGTVMLDIVTTNDDYDYILVNDTDTREVNANGVYIINLWKDNKIIDQREISIGNIDTVIPEIVSVQEVGDTIIVTLDDNLSGLDFSTLIYYKNNISSTDYVLDVNKRLFLLFMKKILLIKSILKITQVIGVKR
ncbi:MAG: RNA polymerase sigma factor [Coprobacillaceae bacterium]